MDTCQTKYGLLFDNDVKDSLSKSKVRPRIGHESLDWEKYSSTLSLTLAMDGDGWLTRTLYPPPE